MNESLLESAWIRPLPESGLLKFVCVPVFLLLVLFLVLQHFFQYQGVLLMTNHYSCMTWVIISGSSIASYWVIIAGLGIESPLQLLSMLRVYLWIWSTPFSWLIGLQKSRMPLAGLVYFSINFGWDDLEGKRAKGQHQNCGEIPYLYIVKIDGGIG